jgi:Pentapeptide repeats (8 copies)
MIAWFAGQPLALKIALGLLGALLVCFSLWRLWLRKYLEWQNVRTLDIKERVGLKVDFVKTAAQIVGGLFFILTILVAYRNYQVSQKNLDLAQDKQVSELYVKAIEQLGSDKLPVILGGIYALERIARGSHKDKGPILEVFCAYVRQNAPWPPEDPAAAQKRRPWTRKWEKVARPAQGGKSGAGPPEQAKAEKGEEARPEPDTDIQAVLTVLGRLGPARDERGEPQPRNLHFTDLRGADLVWPDLERANLKGAHLEKASLWGAQLKNAFLLQTHLEGARFAGALATRLERAFLKQAHLEGAFLARANLVSAHLEGAYLEKADLGQATLQGAFLEDAHLEEANLAGAYLVRERTSGKPTWSGWTSHKPT